MEEKRRSYHLMAEQRPREDGQMIGWNHSTTIWKTYYWSNKTKKQRSTSEHVRKKTLSS